MNVSYSASVVRWLADECVSPNIVAQLREAGEDVIYVLEFARGAHDREVSAHACRERRLLLTQDKDFGDRVFRLGELLPGIVFLRIEPDRRAMRWPRLLAAIHRFGEDLFGHYTVVEESRFRFRPLLPQR